LRAALTVLTVFVMVLPLALQSHRYSENHSSGCAGLADCSFLKRTWFSAHYFSNGELAEEFAIENGKGVGWPQSPFAVPGLVDLDNAAPGFQHNDSALRGDVMKKSLLLLTLGYSLCFLSACGGNGSGSAGSVSSVASSVGSATHFSVSAPASGTNGTAFSFTVTALDASNNVVTSYSGTVHFTSTDGQAVLPANAMLTSGTGTFSATLKTDGGQTITATDTVTASITGTSNSISVSGPATHFSITAPAIATAGTAFNFTVTALDASNNQVSGYSGTIHLTSSDPQAMLPANSALANGAGSFSATLNTAGNQTITAADTENASITGISSSIQVSTSASGFTPTGSMVSTREDHTATLLNDGKVLIVGGMHWAKVPGCLLCGLQLSALASAELYDPATGEFTSTGSMSVPRVFHTATLLGNGKVLVAGGDNRYGTTYSTAELYDPATGAFTVVGNTMTTERTGHTATLLANGKVLLAGGASVGGSSSTAEVFDPTTEEFTPTGSMSVGRFFFTATLLNDGRVLVAGGICDDNGCTGAGTSSAELFDPATNTFALTGSMSVERSSHAATLLTNGSVLVTGGATSAGVTATAELFNPLTGVFAPTGSMQSPREIHTATRLTSGNVLVTGGINGNVTLSSAELFDPASGSFMPAGNMETERSDHTATLLMNSQVLISGGINNQNGGLNSLATAELFP
jgi:Galactose oxidase, central domain